MRIALLNFTHFEVTTGGVETRYRLLERALSSAGHDVSRVATTTTPAECVVSALDASDLVISDSAVCIASSCPIITVFGNPWYSVLNLTPDDWHIAYIAQREKVWHSKNATVKVAVSDFMASEMNLAGTNADKIIPNPVDIGRFSNRQARAVPPIILWCGSRAEIKQYAEANEIAKARIPAKWVFALKGSRQFSYQKMTEAYESASVVLCTSYAEGCSNSLMESLGANTPIVTSAVGIFTSWWDERLGERVRESKDTKEYIRCLRTVLGSPEKYSPRDAVIDAGLDYGSWAGKWQKLVLEVAG